MYEHLAESEKGDEVVQRLLDRRSVRWVGRSYTGSVLDLAMWATVLIVSVRRWIVVICRAVDLHAK